MIEFSATEIGPGSSAPAGLNPGPVPTSPSAANSKTNERGEMAGSGLCWRFCDHHDRVQLSGTVELRAGFWPGPPFPKPTMPMNQRKPGATGAGAHLQRLEDVLRKLLRVVGVHSAEGLRHPALQPEGVPPDVLQIRSYRLCSQAVLLACVLLACFLFQVLTHLHRPC